MAYSWPSRRGNNVELAQFKIMRDVVPVVATKSGSEGQED